MQPDNDNNDPFEYADTALAELYRLRRELLAVDGSKCSLSWWRKRQAALAAVAKVERLLLAHL